MLGISRTPRGPGGGEAHRDERIERVVTPRAKPPLGRRRVIGKAEPVEAGSFGRAGHRADP